MSEIRVKENESLDSALRRFKRSCARSGVLAEVRKREHYEKPSVRRKKKSEAARKESAKRMIKEQLLQDLKTAMREKDVLRRDMLQIARAAYLQTEKDSQTELDDAGVIALIAKEVKKREELLADLKTSDRQDIIDRTKAEIAIFEAYLPEQMDAAQVEEVVRKAIAATGATAARDMGMVMKAVIPEIAGRADNKLVNQVVRRLLA